MKSLLLLVTAVVMSSFVAYSQSSDPELDYIKKAYSKEKKAIVEAYMNLDVQSGAKFWGVYGDYEAGREKLSRERVKLIEEYVNNAENISPEMADRIATSVLANNVALNKLNQSTFKKMKKAVGPVNAAKFIQLETYLQTTWRAAIQDVIPMIGELDQSQK